MNVATRAEIHQRLQCPERDISTWLIQGDAYRTYDLNFNQTYFEPFLQPQHWLLDSNAIFDLSVTPWGYRFEHKRAKGNQSTNVSVKVDPAKPWAVEIEFHMVEMAERSLFGIVFDVDAEAETQHIFLVNPSERVFYVSQSTKGVYDHKARREFSPALGDSHVTLRVDQIGGYWQYFVDEWLVYLHPAETLTTPVFGAFIDGKATVDLRSFKAQWVL